MCEFCENIPNIGDEDTSPCIVKNKEKYQVYFHGLDYDYYDIAYCPLCGRKLSEE